MRQLKKKADIIFGVIGGLAGFFVSSAITHNPLIILGSFFVVGIIGIIIGEVIGGKFKGREFSFSIKRNK